MDALNKNLIKNFEKLEIIKQEVKFGKNTRFDFQISKNNKMYFIEVKNVTLSRQTKLLNFQMQLLPEVSNILMNF